MPKIKKWLRKQKIIFETIAAFSISAMAIIISIAQLNVMEKQTTLLEYQIKIQRQQSSPLFIIDDLLIFDDENKPANTEMIIIINKGNIAYTLAADVAVFLNITYHPMNNPFEEKNKIIPIQGYFDTTIYPETGSEIFVYLVGHLNHKKRADLERDLDIVAKEKDFVINLEVERYVKISYNNVLDEPEVQYFFVPAINNPIKLDNKEGAQKFNEYKESEVMDISILNAQGLFNKLTEN